jgi:hypothetical protein
VLDVPFPRESEGGLSLAAVGASASPLPATLPVAPGGEAACEIKVRNTGNVVDEFTFEILGAAAPWTVVEPSTLHLFPGSEQSVRLRLKPPRQCTTTAGPTPFGLKVNSKEDPAHSVVEQGVLDIGAYSEATAQVVPQTSHTRRAAEHRVTVSNLGNQRLEASLTASDPDNVLTFQTAPPVLAIEACAKAEAVLNVEARKTKIVGRPEPHGFQVVIESAGTQPLTVAGTLLQRPLLPWWALAIVAVLIVVLAQRFGTKPMIAVILVILGALALMPRSRKFLQQLGKSTHPPAR